MSRLTHQAARVFARVDAVLEAIENGQDPRPAVRRLEAAVPWDVIKLGQAFVEDALDTGRGERGGGRSDKETEGGESEGRSDE